MTYQETAFKLELERKNSPALVEYCIYQRIDGNLIPACFVETRHLATATHVAIVDKKIKHFLLTRPNQV